MQFGWFDPFFHDMAIVGDGKKQDVYHNNIHNHR